MKKPIVIFLIYTMLSIPPAMAIDFSKFETTCVEIGFKRNTETFGDCVLELVARNKKVEAKKAESLVAAKQLEYERQKERGIETLRQQQAIQQQQLAIQQQQAMQRQQEPSFASSLGAVLLGAAIGYGGRRNSSPPVQSYQPIQTYQPPIRCNFSTSKFGNYINTDGTCR